jgi:hypothetical protein
MTATNGFITAARASLNGGVGSGRVMGGQHSSTSRGSTGDVRGSTVEGGAGDDGGGAEAALRAELYTHAFFEQRKMGPGKSLAREMLYKVSAL